jgi:hypothetical protein
MGTAMLELTLKERFGSSFTATGTKITEFLNDQQENHDLKAIKKDEWSSILILMEETNGGDMSKMNEEEACWPILIDHLIAHLKN